VLRADVADELRNFYSRFGCEDSQELLDRASCFSTIATHTTSNTDSVASVAHISYVRHLSGTLSTGAVGVGLLVDGSK
jgi:hypothetical protein